MPLTKQLLSIHRNISIVQKRTVAFTFQGINALRSGRSVSQPRSFPGVHSRSYTTATSYYDTLGLSPKATQAQVKAAYYRLSKQHHPDISKEVGAKEKFAVISEAYEVLGNVKNRRQYDRGMLSPSHGTSTDVDIEFESKIKRGKFAKRSGKPHTGRSHAFNFDEYHREHYGDTIRMNYKAHEAKTRMQEGRKKAYKQDMTMAWTLGTAIFSCVIWMYRKHQK